MNVESFLKTMDYESNSEDDRAARAWLSGHGAKFGHFINGSFTDPVDDNGLAVLEPSTGRELARVSLAGSEEVEAAVSAARKAHARALVVRRTGEGTPALVGRGEAADQLAAKVFVTGASPDIGAAPAIASSGKCATFGFVTC